MVITFHNIVASSLFNEECKNADVNIASFIDYNYLDMGSETCALN